MSLDAKEIHNELIRRSNRARTASAYSGAADDSHTPLDLGEGLSANAQREILEVLLAHPSLFDDIKDKISPQNFDVPALERVTRPSSRRSPKKRGRRYKPSAPRSKTRNLRA